MGLKILFSVQLLMLPGVKVNLLTYCLIKEIFIVHLVLCLHLPGKGSLVYGRFTGTGDPV